MANKILQDASKLLALMFEESEKGPEKQNTWFDGKLLAELSGLSPKEVNDAIEFLDDRGLVERMNYSGSYPYVFSQTLLNSRGRYAYYEMISPDDKTSDGGQTSTSMGTSPPLPVGSPFGFTDLDWEFVHKKKKQKDNLFVVMGFQFQSDYYNTENLKANIKQSFELATAKYNERGGRDSIKLEFKPLAAGYGEHLFNQIARYIIAADIAVFETSDMNSNVMIEMGVALTWGSRVLPIKKFGCPKPPSDISGQTWADYAENGAGFTNESHQEEVLAMIERAIQKKSA